MYEDVDSGEKGTVRVQSHLMIYTPPAEYVDPVHRVADLLKRMPGFTEVNLDCPSPWEISVVRFGRKYRVRLDTVSTIDELEQMHPAPVQV